MARAKIKAALAKVNSKVRQWTLNVISSDPNDYEAMVRDENSWAILPILENDDYNQLSSLIRISKYMSDQHDMAGLAAYLLDRGLVQMTQEEKQAWKKKKIKPIELKEQNAG